MKSLRLLFIVISLSTGITQTSDNKIPTISAWVYVKPTSAISITTIYKDKKEIINPGKWEKLYDNENESQPFIIEANAEPYFPILPKAYRLSFDGRSYKPTAATPKNDNQKTFLLLTVNYKPTYETLFCLCRKTGYDGYLSKKSYSSIENMILDMQ